MRKGFYYGLIWVGVLALFIRCGEDAEPRVESLFANGVFIVNEGNFTESDGSLSYYDFDSSEVANHIFEAINDRPLAAIFQSMAMYAGRGYIVDTNGRIEIVDAKDLTSIGAIDGDLDLPRYFAGFGNYGYVTDWGLYDENWANPDSKIHVIDLEAMSVSESLNTPSRPEGIMAINGLVYVANSATNLITVYDPASNNLIDSIEVNNGPIQFVMDRNQDLWVISNGAYISGGALQQIDLQGGEVNSTVDLSDIFPNGRLAINGNRDVLFFMGETWAADFSYTENKVYKTSINDPGRYTEIIDEKNLYGLGVDPQHEEVYVADAVAFQGNGKVYTYDFAGNKLDEYSVGRGPRDFVFLTK